MCLVLLQSTYESCVSVIWGNEGRISKTKIFSLSVDVIADTNLCSCVLSFTCYVYCGERLCPLQHVRANSTASVT